MERIPRPSVNWLSGSGSGIAVLLVCASGRYPLFSPKRVKGFQLITVYASMALMFCLVPVVAN